MLYWRFNAFIHASEKQSKSPPPYKQMEEFRMTLDSCNFVDLGFKGYSFTWNNKRPGQASTREWLDWAVANPEWRDKFLARIVTHLFSHASDHLPLILHSKMDREYRVRGSWRSKFEESWLLWEDCETVIRESWAKYKEEISELDNIKSKIAGYRKELKDRGTSKTPN